MSKAKNDLNKVIGDIIKYLSNPSIDANRKKNVTISSLTLVNDNNKVNETIVNYLNDADNLLKWIKEPSTKQWLTDVNYDQINTKKISDVFKDFGEVPKISLFTEKEEEILSIYYTDNIENDTVIIGNYEKLAEIKNLTSEKELLDNIKTILMNFKTVPFFDNYANNLFPTEVLFELYTDSFLKLKLFPTFKQRLHDRWLSLPIQDELLMYDMFGVNEGDIAVNTFQNKDSDDIPDIKSMLKDIKCIIKENTNVKQDEDNKANIFDTFNLHNKLFSAGNDNKGVQFFDFIQNYKPLTELNNMILSFSRDTYNYSDIVDNNSFKRQGELNIVKYILNSSIDNILKKIKNFTDAPNNIFKNKTIYDQLKDEYNIIYNVELFDNNFFHFINPSKSVFNSYFISSMQLRSITYMIDCLVNSSKNYVDVFGYKINCKLNKMLKQTLKDMYDEISKLHDAINDIEKVINDCFNFEENFSNLFELLSL